MELHSRVRKRWSRQVFESFKVFILSCFLLSPFLSSLHSQCESVAVALPDMSQPVADPDTMYCVSFTVFPDITGYPIGLSIDLEHTWQGDLSIRALACDETLMVMTRPGSLNPFRAPGSCGSGSPFGSSEDFDGTFLFLDSLTVDPDDDMNINGGSYGLSGDRCNINTVSTFHELASACDADSSFVLTICIADHAFGDEGFASNIFPLFEIPPICGCTDPLASNYDPEANVDDGSCEFPPCFPDTIPPEILCPENILAIVESFGDPDVFVELPLAEAEDDCQLESIENDYNDGGADASDIFPTGITEIIFTATDTSGNTSACTTVVDVSPILSLEAVCNDFSIALNEDGEAVLGAEDLDGGSSGGSGMLSFSIDGQQSILYSCSDTGLFSLILLVEDEGGQTDDCEAEVTLADIMPPVALCKNSEIYLDESGMAILTADEIDDNSWDNCGIAVRQISQETFECSDQGSQPVVLTLTDFSGNMSSCTALVEVHDTILPLTSCDTSPVTLQLNSNCEVSVGDLSERISAEDNCLEEGDFIIVQVPGPEVILNAEESITLLLTISDGAGWSYDCEIEVSVQNSSDWQWLSSLPANEELECEEFSQEVVLMAADYCDTLAIVPLVDTIFFCTGSKIIERTWVAPNLEYVQTVSYEDNEPPFWTSPLPVNMAVSCDNIPDPPVLTAEDDCSEVSIQFSEFEIPGSNQGEFILVRGWTASDECGNSISHQQFVTVTDQNPPQLFCPSAVTFDLQGNCELEVPSLVDSITVWDICTDTADIQLVQNPEAGSILSQPTTTVFITAIDLSGNSNFCSFSLTLENFGAPPSLICDSSPIIMETEPDECGANIDLQIDWNEGCGNATVENSFNEGGENASGFYPTGDKWVVFELVEDGQVLESCSIEVSVLDLQPPEIICPSIVYAQLESNEDSLVWVDIPEVMAEDNCGLDTLFNDFNDNGPNASDSFPPGITTITFTAIDQSQNEVYCELPVVVLDSMQSPDTFQISGYFSSPQGNFIGGVSLEIEGDTNLTIITQPNGYYSFSVPSFYSITVTPVLDTNWLDGVSTLDLILIQRAIIGLDTLESPYSYIASDVNNDGLVSTIDLVLLQRVIIGLDYSIESNTSWRFVPEDYDFENPSNPQLENWPESRTYSIVSEDKPQENWISIKIGDLSGEASGQVDLQEVK